MLLLGCSLGVAWVLQGGFGPGAHTTPPDLVDALGAALLALPCVYYVIVARRVWTRKLWVAGVVIHLFVLLVILAVAVVGRAGSLAPVLFLLGGFTAWILYAKRNTFSKDSG